MYGAGGYFGVHRLPGLQVPRRSRTRRARRRPQALAARAREPRPADRRRDDADAGGQAVLRQPHHVRRQHDDPRQRHPARDAAARERGVQHRGAEVQHQAAESARLLQAARGRQGRHRREDAERDQQGRRPGEAGGAEPQSDQLRRRRLAVRGLLRPAVVPDRATSSAAARASPCRCGRLARAELHAGLHRAVPVRPQHHRRRQSVPAATSATSASSRRSRPAAS